MDYGMTRYLHIFRKRFGFKKKPFFIKVISHRQRIWRVAGNAKLAIAII